MSQISWREIAAPNFSAANALIGRGQDQMGKAAEVFTQGLNNFADANQKQNTNKLMDLLHTARDPNQFNNAEFQGQLGALREGLGQDYDMEKFRTAYDGRLGKLQADALSGIAYQDKQDEVHNRPLLSQYYQAIENGDQVLAQNTLSSMRGETAQHLLKGVDLRGSLLDQDKSRQSMRLADSADQLGWDKYQTDVQNSNRQYELDYAKAEAAAGKGGTRVVADANGDLIEVQSPGSGLGITPTQIIPGSRGGSGGNYGGNNSPVSGIIAEAAKQYGLDEGLLSSLIGTESGFNANARSPAGAQGYGQLMPGTAKAMGVTNPNDPRQNIMGSAKYLSQMVKMFNGNVEHALNAYNWGPGNMQSFLKTGKGKTTANMPQETKDHAQRILSGSRNYGNGGGGNRPRVVPIERPAPKQGALAAAASQPANVITNPSILTAHADNFKIETAPEVNRAKARLDNMAMNRTYENIKGVGSLSQWVDKYAGIRDGNERPNDIVAGLKTHPSWKKLTPQQQVNMAESTLRFIKDNRSSTLFGDKSYNPFTKANGVGNKLPFNQLARIYANQAFAATESWENEIKRYGLQEQKLRSNASIMKAYN